VNGEVYSIVSEIVELFLVSSINIIDLGELTLMMNFELSMSSPESADYDFGLVIDVECAKPSWKEGCIF